MKFIDKYLFVFSFIFIIIYSGYSQNIQSDLSSPSSHFMSNNDNIIASIGSDDLNIESEKKYIKSPLLRPPVFKKMEIFYFAGKEVIMAIFL